MRVFKYLAIEFVQHINNRLMCVFLSLWTQRFPGQVVGRATSQEQLPLGRSYIVDSNTFLGIGELPDPFWRSLKMLSDTTVVSL